MSLKRVKIGPRLLLITNRKLHTGMRFQVVPTSMTLDDLERPFCTLVSKYVHLSGGNFTFQQDGTPFVKNC